jgi:hypothetical protein
MKHVSHRLEKEEYGKAIMKRRELIKNCTGLAAAGLGVSGEQGTADAQERMDTGLNIYFGDLHNHNSVGYGLGSPERAFEIAKSHLDFFCFTPHAYHDTSEQIHTMKEWTGFEKITRDRWPEVLELNRVYHYPGSFVTFPGYERHSSSVGHYHIIFPFDGAPLEYFAELGDFQKHAFDQGAIIVPHHPGYLEGMSGAVPRHWDPRVSPILEMYSEHGNAECDTASFDYIRHSMGPRVTGQTMQAFLAECCRFGIVASTDDHLGFPGAYGEGKAAVLAPELTRAAVFNSLKKRRCYGVTGDRIELDFRVNGRIMGEELPFAGTRAIRVAVRGWDRLGQVEVLRNNRVIHREFSPDIDPFDIRLNQPVIIRLEYGWGPMSENQIPLDRIPEIFDWDFSVRFDHATILAVQPCWQSAPLDENRRHVVSERNENGFSLKSYTSRRRCLFNRDTHIMAIRIQGQPAAVLTLDIRQPEPKRLTISLADLLHRDTALRVGRNCIKVHRAVPEAQAAARFSLDDHRSGDRTDWYYLRVVQANGQLAWSSPVWVEKRTQ